MILTCPNCASCFKLDSELLGKKGSKVRCSSCGDVWFEEPEIDDDGDIEEDDHELYDAVNEAIDAGLNPDDLSDDEDKPFLDAETVQDFADYVDDLNLNVRVKPDALVKKNKSIGYGAAVASFFIIFIYLLANSASIAKEHTSMHSFYSLLGMKIDFPGQGLVFDEVKASDNGSNIVVDGHIVNLESDERVVPLIEASLLGEGDKVINRWYIEPPKGVMEAEEVLSFDSIYYKREGGAPHKSGEMNLRVRFILPSSSGDSSEAKTGVEDEGSNQELGQSGSGRQSDHAGSPKSHQPASSGSHQESGD